MRRVMGKVNKLDIVVLLIGLFVLWATRPRNKCVDSFELGSNDDGLLLSETSFANLNSTIKGLYSDDNTVTVNTGGGLAFRDVDIRDELAVADSITRLPTDFEDKLILKKAGQLDLVWIHTQSNLDMSGNSINCSGNISCDAMPHLQTIDTDTANPTDSVIFHTAVQFTGSLRSDWLKDLRPVNDVRAGNENCRGRFFNDRDGDQILVVHGDRVTDAVTNCSFGIYK